jgi:CheY-like chemotaxis protein
LSCHSDTGITMTPKTVLLAEDDPDDRELFAFFYADRKDITVLPAVSNGVELVEYLQAIAPGDKLPDLIVLDQNMPRMNGKQALTFIKSTARFSAIPTVIYSTYTDSNLVLECTRLGASMVALKPMDHEGYRKMMDDFLRGM